MARNPPGSDRTIVLIGFRGVGKSTVGRRIAELMNGGYVDTDELLTCRTGRTIVELFEELGEREFRRLETQAIQTALEERPAVLSVGGGALMAHCNRDRICAAGNVVWLTAPAEVLWDRILADPSTASNRPKLTRLGGIEEIRQLLAEREPVYSVSADLIVDTTDKNPQSIALGILGWLEGDRNSAPEDHSI
jgi:shikimate kinase